MLNPDENLKALLQSHDVWESYPEITHEVPEERAFETSCRTRAALGIVGRKKANLAMLRFCGPLALPSASSSRIWGAGKNRLVSSVLHLLREKASTKTSNE